MQQFEHTPHPWIARRRGLGPPQTADERVGFNGRLGAFITRQAGTLWAFYFATVFTAIWTALAVWGPLEHFDPYPFAFLLFLGNIVQLLLMFVILVGQQVLGAAADKRSVQSYKDAEAILQECLRLQEHLAEQDETLAWLVEAETGRHRL